MLPALQDFSMLSLSHVRNFLFLLHIFLISPFVHLVRYDIHFSKDQLEKIDILPTNVYLR